MRRLRPVDVMLIATIVIWAFNITVTKYILTHGFQPLAYGAIRYHLTSVVIIQREDSQAQREPAKKWLVDGRQILHGCNF